MTREDALPNVAFDTPQRVPMSTRWWLFLVSLWSIVLVGAAPLLLIPSLEKPISVINFPGLDITSVSVIQKKPILDWLGHHSRYSLEVVRQNKTTRYAWPNSNWQLRTTPSGIELTSSDGTIYLPPAPISK